MAGPRYGRLVFDLLKNGLDMKDGEAIILGYVGTEALIINVAGNATYPIVDGNAAVWGPDALTPAPGSLVIDTTNGLLFVVDSGNLWQQVTV